MKHNHRPNWGIPVEGCPRCLELKAKPYILKYKIAGDRKLQRVPVASVREAVEFLQAKLPAVIEGVPVVERPGGETIAILQAF